MEDKKYYTPEIDEFCVGFEYEYKHSKNINLWTKMSFSFDVLRFDLESPLKNEIRVKYLDEQDILDLGFEKLETKPYEKLQFININPDNRDQRIHLEDDQITEGFGKYLAIENNCGDFYFKGWLKNKNELIKLLKQVGI